MRLRLLRGKGSPSDSENTSGERMATDLTGGIDRAREHVFVEIPERAGTRDAVNVWVEEQSGAFAMRVGVEATAPQWDAHEIWLDIAFPDGRVLSLRDEGRRHDPIGPEGEPTILGAGPLRFRCVRPFEHWSCSFRPTPVPEITVQDLLRKQMPSSPPLQEVEFEFEMDMAVPPWVPGSLLPEAGRILNEGAEGDFMSPRYEQLFRARGRLRIGDDQRQFAANGLRIRRQGYRAFQGFPGHCWQSAVFPSGKAFGLNIYPPEGDAPNYCEGWVFDGSGPLIPARPVEVPWLTELLPSGDKLHSVLETVDGRCVEIDGEVFANTRSRGSAVLPPDFPIVVQAHARYRWDGEETVGMMERSSKPDRFVRLP